MQYCVRAKTAWQMNAQFVCAKHLVKLQTTERLQNSPSPTITEMIVPRKLSPSRAHPNAVGVIHRRR